MFLSQFNIKISRISLSILAAVLLMLVTAGCYDSKSGRVEFGGAINFELPAFPETGSHAVLVFSEMHYSDSYRVQEVPRLLPPEGSVPVTGGEVKILDLDELKGLDIPKEFVASYDDVNAQKVYSVNCQVCHGIKLDGAGPITTLLSARNDGSLAYDGAEPVNLNSDRVRELTDGEIFGYITWGGRPGLAAAARGKTSSAIMPEFGKLLTEEERWELVHYLRSRIGSK
jgi:mono/diheme cytochrome c family protein